MTAFGSIFFAAIALSGVTGRALRARAFFDANNVKVGDPLVLTIDFVGEADFKDLHPPALSQALNRRDWKLDDASAKTDTFRDARRLTYRIRPMREGVVYFPSLEFSFAGSDGSVRTVRANEIPVHAKAGQQVVVSEMAEDPNALPEPPACVADAAFAAPGLVLSDDTLFAWRKACATPTADGFAAFDFPAAKLNEATAAIRAGNWARALKVYRRLEWRIGQTPEIERGIIAALALKFDSPSVELPVWRQVLRPLLKYDWRLRIGLVLGGFAILALLFWLLGRGIRAVACVALSAALVLAAEAETTETVTTNADGSVTVTKTVRNGSFSYTSSSTTGGTGTMRMRSGRSLFDSDPFEMFGGFNPFGSRRRTNRPKPQITVDLAPDKPSVTVGEEFNLILSLEMPRYVALSEGIRLSLAEQDKMVQVGKAENLANERSANPTNVIRRLVFPMRANEPFKGLHYAVESEYVYVQDRSFFRQAVPFSSGNRTGRLEVKPLPDAGKPCDWGGIVSEGLQLHEYCDLLQVETNDVITITYRMRPRGFVPADFLPAGVAFEWTRQQDETRQIAEIEYRRFFVANGTNATPRVSVSYYDPRAKAYRRAETGGTKIRYTP